MSILQDCCQFISLFMTVADSHSGPHANHTSLCVVSNEIEIDTEAVKSLANTAVKSHVALSECALGTSTHNQFRTHHDTQHCTLHQLFPMSTYDSLHRQCRTLESLFDSKLTSYSRLASTMTRPGVEDVEASGSAERWKDLEIEVEELLTKVRCLLSQNLQITKRYFSWVKSTTS